MTVLPASPPVLAARSLGPVDHPSVREAVQRGELLLHYQPIVELRSRRPVAAEALLRWQRPQGLLAPGAFWSQTDARCAREVGRFVLATATRQVAAWREQGLCGEVSINTDPRELSADWVAAVYEALSRNRLPASALNIELTETSRIDPRSGAELAAALIRHGVGVALDDAGTGFNALAAISEVPLTELKIDRGFVAGLGESRADALVRALVTLAADLGMRTVAEGVETEQQAHILEQYGVDRAQGYLFSRPVPADELASFWRQERGESAVSVQVIRAMARSGASPTTIAAALNRRGAPGPRGRRWRSETVLRVLAGDVRGVASTNWR